MPFFLVPVYYTPAGEHCQQLFLIFSVFVQNADAPAKPIRFLSAPRKMLHKKSLKSHILLLHF